MVRFDDPTSPETTVLARVDLPSRAQPAAPPALVFPAPAVGDAEVVLALVSWSVGGNHLTFVTRQAGLTRLWVASAADGFAPREITLGAADNLVPRWVGDETLAIAVVRNSASIGGQVDFVRVNAPDLSLELLGSYLGLPESGGGAADNATHQPNQEQYRLAEEGGTLFVPSRWPAP